MPEYHAEPYIYLPAVTHKSALIAWGAFYFRVTSRGAAKLVDDQDLKYVHPPRKDSIGACSAPYGPALVEVRDAGGTVVATAKSEAASHCGSPVFLNKWDCDSLTAPRASSIHSCACWDFISRSTNGWSPSLTRSRALPTRS